MRGWRVFVTGASGFIGSPLCSRLSDQGAEVHALSRFPRRERDGRRWWQADLRDIDTLRAIMASVRPDHIFHLAGETTAARRMSLVVPHFHNTLETTVNLLTVAAEVGCRRTVLAGSLEDPSGRREGDGPSSPYAAAKWAGRAYAQMFHNVFGLPTVVARVFMTYGPGQRDEEKLVPYVTASLLRGEVPKLTSGRRLVDWIYIDDVVEGFLALREAPGVDGSSIDLGSGRLVSVRDVVKHLVALTGSSIQPEFDVLADRPSEQEVAADVTQTHAKMGWRPRTPLEEGLRSTVSWYRTQAGFTEDMPAGPIRR